MNKILSLLLAVIVIALTSCEQNQSIVKLSNNAKVKVFNDTYQIGDTVSIAMINYKRHISVNSYDVDTVVVTAGIPVYYTKGIILTNGVNEY